MIKTLTTERSQTLRYVAEKIWGNYGSPRGIVVEHMLVEDVAICCARPQMLRARKLDGEMSDLASYFTLVPKSPAANPLMNDFKAYRFWEFHVVTTEASEEFLDMSRLEKAIKKMERN